MLKYDKSTKFHCHYFKEFGPGKIFTLINSSHQKYKIEILLSNVKVRHFMISNTVKVCYFQLARDSFSLKISN